MDAWQTSVETRLTSLDARLGRVEPDIATLKTDVAVIKNNLSHMPTKTDLANAGQDITDKLTKKLQVYGGVIGLLIVVATAAGKLIGQA